MEIIMTKDDICMEYYHVDTPDFEIKIGVHDGKVMGIYWEEMNKFLLTRDEDLDADKIDKMVRKYIMQALVFHNKFKLDYTPE
jgi:hypothetical protein